MQGRFWLGSGILALMLALGLFASWGMSQINEPVADKLEQAAQAALDGQFEHGAALAAEASERWQSHWDCVAAVADHGPMEEIDSIFAQLETYAQNGDAGAFAAWCARLSCLVDAMGDAHDLTWRNLL